MKYIIYDSLPHGRKNAVTADYLCALFGFRSKRELRRHVQRERMAGAIIASGETGYYIPESKQELAMYVQRSENMAKTIFCTLKAARAAIQELDDQMELEIEQ